MKAARTSRTRAIQNVEIISTVTSLEFFETRTLVDIWLHWPFSRTEVAVQKALSRIEMYSFVEGGRAQLDAGKVSHTWP